MPSLVTSQIDTTQQRAITGISFVPGGAAAIFGTGMHELSKHSKAPHAGVRFQRSPLQGHDLRGAEGDHDERCIEPVDQKGPHFRG